MNEQFAGLAANIMNAYGTPAIAYGEPAIACGPGTPDPEFILKLADQYQACGYPEMAEGMRRLIRLDIQP